MIEVKILGKNESQPIVNRIRSGDIRGAIEFMVKQVDREGEIWLETMEAIEGKHGTKAWESIVDVDCFLGLAIAAMPSDAMIIDGLKGVLSDICRPRADAARYLLVNAHHILDPSGLSPEQAQSFGLMTAQLKSHIEEGIGAKVGSHTFFMASECMCVQNYLDTLGALVVARDLGGERWRYTLYRRTVDMLFNLLALHGARDHDIDGTFYDAGMAASRGICKAIAKNMPLELAQVANRKAAEA